MEDAPRRLVSKPTYLITQLSVHARRLISEAFSSRGARAYHYRLLATLDEFGPASQAELGRRGNMDRSDVVVALNELVAAGQAERTPDPTDGRRNIIRVTEEGLAQLQRLEDSLDLAQERFGVPLDEEEQAQFYQLLARMLAYHNGVPAQAERTAAPAPAAPAAPVASQF
ncbi:DNA-binding MarR family transcriptional regulator [Crossiella equi]|uniref:DNA-binding MarR family transcriptional regulator n=1 Tax=Crossiella equi TaxID=130796 RepID=A0ABS5A7P2_9PSEU|nr:MarR family winged helix-turn-helix transcriptional regulator [Crossiella equi]MBP2472612.1 DNA-binding MarR family transcriptional regulator [Crossiella equi]